MTQQKLIDILLILIGGAITLISFFYLEAGVSRFCFLVFGISLACIVLIVWIRGRNSGRKEQGSHTFFCQNQLTEVVLLSEEDQSVASWPLYGKTSMVIGRDVGENQVTINLSGSTYASMIEVEHAVLNYSAGNWYIEDLSSKNGVSVQKRVDGHKYKLAAGQPCKLDSGDIIYIGLTRLLIR